MTKKGKRTAVAQRTEQIADLQRENEELKARLAECEKRAGEPRPTREPSVADTGSAIDAFIICDSGMTVTDVDEAALRYFGAGLHKEDVIGKDLADLMADGERYESYLKVLETGERFTVEESVVLPDGGQVDVITRAFRVGDGLGILISDVTAQKRMERELRESEKRSRLILENASEGIAVLQDGVMKYINPGLAAMSGFSIEEGIGKPFLDFIHPDDRQMAVDNYVRRQRGEAVPSRYEFRFLHKDGSTGWAQISVALHEWEGKTATLTLMTDISDRKRAEEELERKEHYFRALIEHSSDGVMIVSRDGAISYESPGCQRMLGYEKQERAGKSPFEPMHPDDIEAATAAMDQVLKGYQPRVEVRGLHKDGSWHYVDAGLTNLLDDPVVQGVVINLRDVTERRLAEEKLRQSEEKYRTLADQSIQGIMIAQGVPPRVVYCNAAMAEIAGRTVEEMLSLSPREMADLVHPEDRDMFFERFAERLKGQPAEPRYQIRGVRRDGEVRWLEVFATAVEYQDERAVQAVFVDITERKLTDEKLRRSEERFRLITENMLEAVSLVDASGIVQYVSPSHERLVGYRPEDMIGRPTVGFVHPDDVNDVLAQLAQISEKGEAHIQYRFRHSDGHYLWGEASVKALRDKAGEISGYVIAGRDVSDRRQAEESLKASEEKYRRLFESTQTAVEVVSLETGLVVLANEATARMFGFASAADLVGVDSMQYLRPEDVGWVSSRMAQSIGQNWQEIAEVQARTNDGRWIWVSGMTIATEYQGKPALLISMLDITRLKQTEETLRASEEKYRLLTEKTNDLIFTTDLNLKNTYVSPSVERILGFTPEEFSSLDITQLMTPESLARAQERLMEQQTLEKDLKADRGRSVRIELEYHRKDGSTVWLENVATSLRDANGTVVGVHGVARDISDRRQAQEALRASEERFRTLIEKATDVVVVLDANGRTLYQSPSLQRITGYEPHEWVDRSWTDFFVHPDDTAPLATALERILTRPGAALEGISARYRHKDGSWRFLEGTVTNMLHDPKVNGLVANFRDVTERRQAEESLRASEEKYKALFEHTLLGMEVVDGATGRVVLANHSIARMFGFKSPVGMIGHNPMDYILPEDLEWVTNQFAKMLADPEMHETAMIRARTEDGRIIWVLGSTTSFQYEGKLAALISLVDMTVTKESEMKLHESEEKYRLLTEKTSDLVFLTDLAFRNSYVSPSVERILGFTPEEHMQRDAAQQMTPESLARAAEALREQLALEQDPKADPNRSVRIDLECYRKGGSTVWLEQHVSFVRDAGGKVVGLHGGARDISERRKAEQALRDSELKYKNLFENTLMGTEVIDVETGRIVLANRSIAQMFGFKSPEDMVGIDAVTVCVLPEDLERTSQEIARSIADPERREVATLRARGPDGKVRWVSGMAALIEYNGKPALLISLIDVSATKEAELKLQESEEKNRLLVDNATEGIAVVRDGVLKFANRRFAEYVGYSAEELVGRAFADFIHPDDRQRVAEYFSGRSGQEALSSHQFRWIDRQASVHWGEASIAGLGWEGQPATLCMLGDITERRQAEEALRASEERHRLLTERANDIVYTSDINLRGTYISPSVERILGFTPEERLRQQVSEQMTPESFARAMEVLARQLEMEKDPNADPNRIVRLELEYYRKDGSTVWLEDQISGIRDEHGTMVGIHGVARDMTERMKAEEALRESERRLKEAQRQGRMGDWEYDFTSQKVIWSDQTYRLYDRDPALSPPTWEEQIGYYLPEQQKAIMESAYRAIETGEESAYDLEAKLPSGRTVHFHATMRATKDAGGRVTKLSGTLQDITERKRMEQELRASEEMFRTIFEKSPIGAIVFDAAGSALDANQALQNMFGQSREATMKRPGLFASPIMTDQVRGRLKAGEVVNREVEIGALAGAQESGFPAEVMGFYVRAVLAPLGLDKAGSPRGYLVLLEDISERKRMERLIQEQRDLAHQLSSVSDLAEGLHLCLETAMRLAGMDSGGVYLVDQASGGLRLVCHAGLSDRFVESASYFTPESPNAKVVSSGSPTYAQHRALGVPLDNARQAEGLRALAVIPFFHEGRVLGCVNIASHTLDEVPQATRGPLETICLEIGGAVARLNAQKSLRESEERYRLLAENATDVIWTMDMDFRYTYISPSTTRVTGFSVEESLAMSIEETLAPASYDAVGRIVLEELAAEEESRGGRRRPRIFEAELKCKDGSTIWVEVLAAFLHDAYGKPSGILGVSRDIRERRQAQEALKESEAAYRVMFDQSPNAMALTRLTGEYTDVNRRFLEEQTLTRAEILGKTSAEVGNVTAEQSNAMAKEFERSGKLDRYEARIWSPAKGEWHDVLISASVIPAKGESMVLTVINDVTERKRAEEELRKAHAELEARVEQRTAELREANSLLTQEISRRQEAQEKLQESESRYRGLVESANSVILELDAKGRITFFNRFAQEFFGFPESEIVGRHVVGTIAPDVDSDGKDRKALTRDLIKHPENYAVIENEGIRQNGERVWISWTNKGIYDAKGRLRNILCIGMDRTEQKRVAEMLAQQMKEKAAADERQRLARDLHDAVTQMLFSANLIAAVLPKLWAKDAAEGQRRLEELRQLTRGALAEMRMLLMELRPASLAEAGLVDLLRHLAESAAGHSGFPVSFSVDGECDAPVEVQIALYRVAQEALNNVVKHAGASAAQIHLVCRGNSAKLTVSDNGSGFDLKRVSPTHLGLRIMQERAEAVGAVLKIVSSERSGTRVAVAWPGSKRKESA